MSKKSSSKQIINKGNFKIGDYVTTTNVNYAACGAILKIVGIERTAVSDSLRRFPITLQVVDVGTSTMPKRIPTGTVLPMYNADELKLIDYVTKDSVVCKDPREEKAKDIRESFAISEPKAHAEPGCAPRELIMIGDYVTGVNSDQTMYGAIGKVTDIDSSGNLTIKVVKNDKAESPNKYTFVGEIMYCWNVSELIKTKYEPITVDSKIDEAEADKKKHAEYEAHVARGKAIADMIKSHGSLSSVPFPYLLPPFLPPFLPIMSPFTSDLFESLDKKDTLINVAKKVKDTAKSQGVKIDDKFVIGDTYIYIGGDKDVKGRINKGQEVTIVYECSTIPSVIVTFTEKSILGPDRVVNLSVISASLVPKKDKKIKEPIVTKKPSDVELIHVIEFKVIDNSNLGVTTLELIRDWTITYRGMTTTAVLVTKYKDGSFKTTTRTQVTCLPDDTYNRNIGRVKVMMKARMKEAEQRYANSNKKLGGK